MTVSNKLVVVTELSQRDRSLLHQIASSVRRIANALAPTEGPGEADIDDDPVSFTRPEKELGL